MNVLPTYTIEATYGALSGTVESPGAINIAALVERLTGWPSPRIVNVNYVSIPDGKASFLVSFTPRDVDVTFSIDLVITKVDFS